MAGARVKTAPTPRERIARVGPGHVLRFETPAGVEPRVGAAPVLLAPSIINRSYIFDLRERQSLAAFLLAAGLDVYLIDWGEPTAADASLGLEDYAVRLTRRAIAAVRERSGAPSVSLLGYCLGGTFALIAAAAGVRGIDRVCALTTPVDLSAPGALGQLTDARLLDTERLMRAFTVVPGELLWASFQALDPVGIGAKWRGFIERSDDEEFVARFDAQETWLADPVGVTARALRDVVELLYRENALANGTLRLGGRSVRLEHGQVPILNLIATKDGIVPPSASRPLADLWGGPVTTRELPGGHIGVCVGSRAPQNAWAEMVRFFAPAGE